MVLAIHRGTWGLRGSFRPTAPTWWCSAPLWPCPPQPNLAEDLELLHRHTSSVPRRKQSLRIKPGWGTTEPSVAITRHAGENECCISTFPGEISKNAASNPLPERKAAFEGSSGDTRKPAPGRAGGNPASRALLAFEVSSS